MIYEINNKDSVHHPHTTPLPSDPTDKTEHDLIPSPCGACNNQSNHREVSVSRFIHFAATKQTKR